MVSRIGIGSLLAALMWFTALTGHSTAADAFNQIPAGFVGPVGPNGNPAANAANGAANAGNGVVNGAAPDVNDDTDKERQAYQDLREEILSALEKKYNISAAAIVKQRLAVPPPAPAPEPDPVAPIPAEPEAVTKAVTAFNTAAKELADLKKLIDNPQAVQPAVAKIHEVVTKFDAALKVVQDLKLTQPDQLAIELLRLSIKTIDTAGLKPANILPALIKNLMSELGLTGIFADAVPQAAAANPAAAQAPQLSPTQFVFDRLLKENDLQSEVVKLKSDTAKPAK